VGELANYRRDQRNASPIKTYAFACSSPIFLNLGISSIIKSSIPEQHNAALNYVVVVTAKCRKSNVGYPEGIVMVVSVCFDSIKCYLSQRTAQDEF